MLYLLVYYIPEFRLSRLNFTTNDKRIIYTNKGEALIYPSVGQRPTKKIMCVIIKALKGRNPIYSNRAVCPVDNAISNLIAGFLSKKQ